MEPLGNKSVDWRATPVGFKSQSMNRDLTHWIMTHLSEIVKVDESKDTCDRFKDAVLYIMSEAMMSRTFAVFKGKNCLYWSEEQEALTVKVTSIEKFITDIIQYCSHKLREVIEQHVVRTIPEEHILSLGFTVIRVKMDKTRLFVVPVDTKEVHSILRRLSQLSSIQYDSRGEALQIPRAEQVYLDLIYFMYKWDFMIGKDNIKRQVPFWSERSDFTRSLCDKLGALRNDIQTIFQTDYRRSAILKRQKM